MLGSAPLEKVAREANPHYADIARKEADEAQAVTKQDFDEYVMSGMPLELLQKNFDKLFITYVNQMDSHRLVSACYALAVTSEAIPDLCKVFGSDIVASILFMTPDEQFRDQVLTDIKTKAPKAFERFSPFVKGLILKVPGVGSVAEPPPAHMA